MRLSVRSFMIALLLQVWTAAASLNASAVLTSFFQLQPVYHTHRAVSSPGIHITFPSNHSYWQVAPHTLIQRIPLCFELSGGFAIPRDGFVLLSGTKVIQQHVHVSSTLAMTIDDVSAGTYFWTLQLWRWGKRNEHELVAQATLHFEVVVPQDPSVSFWMHPMVQHPLSQDQNDALLLPKQEGNTRIVPIPVCFATATSGIYDGQKTIWLQVMRALNRHTDRFKVSVKTFESVSEHSPWVQALRGIGVDVEGQPLIVCCIPLPGCPGESLVLTACA